ncbi:hypothetical protein [Nocardia xishanensis]
MSTTFVVAACSVLAAAALSLVLLRERTALGADAEAGEAIEALAAESAR